MGYTHYWRRPQMMDTARFHAFAIDTQKIFAMSEAMGIKLAGGLGEGAPEATGERVWFNGLEACGHAHEELGIAWPAQGAAGIASDHDPVATKTWGPDLIGTLTQGRQASPVPGAIGKLLTARSCGGDCSHETVTIERAQLKAEWDDDHSGLAFSCCKTAFKPYDVTVTAVLIALQHHFPEARVSSDGLDADWEDGSIVVQSACGYGRDFTHVTT